MAGKITDHWLISKGADWYFTLFFGLTLLSSSLSSKFIGIFILILVLWSLVWIVLNYKTIAPFSLFEKCAGITLVAFFLVQQFSKHLVTDPALGFSGGYAHYLLAVIPFYIHARHRVLGLSSIQNWGMFALVVALISATSQMIASDDGHVRANMIFGGHPIMFGDFALVTTMITLSVILGDAASFRKKVIFVLVMASGFLAVIMSGTRGAYLSLPVLLILLVIGDRAINNQKSKIFSPRLIATLLLLCVVLAIGFLLSPKGKNATDRIGAMTETIATLITGKLDIQDIQSINSYGDQYRLLMLTASWQLFLERPLLGHGWGSFTSIKKRWAEQNNLLEHYDQKKANRFLGFNQPHNDYLRFLCEQGLLGFLFLLLFNFGGLWWLWRTLRSGNHSQEQQTYALCALMVALAYIQFYMTEGITSRSAMFSHQLILLSAFVSQVSRLKLRAP